MLSLPARATVLKTGFFISDKTANLSLPARATVLKTGFFISDKTANLSLPALVEPIIGSPLVLTDPSQWRQCFAASKL